MRKNKKSSTILYYTQPFDVSQILDNAQGIHIHQQRSLEQIQDNLRQNCHIFTKDGTQNWRIQVLETQSSGLARSKTSEEFYFHTDHSFSKYPPEYLLLYCQRPDKMGGGISKILSLEHILSQLKLHQIQKLKQPVYEFYTPKQFRNQNIENLIEEKLSVLYETYTGQLLIRYRYDIINKSNLAAQNLSALENLQKIIEKITPVSLFLRQKECMAFKNGKFLHSRTEIKDPSRLLYRIMFNTPKQIGGEIYHNYQFRTQATQLSKKFIQQFKNIVNIQQLPFSEKVFHSDMVNFQSSYKELEIAQRSIYFFFKAIVHIYSENNEMGVKLRNLLDWPEHINKILAKLNQTSQFQPQFYRPDFILQEQEHTNKCLVKICEINCRFATNAYIMSLLLNQIACKQYKKSVSSVHFTRVAEVIQQQFKNQQQIYFITKLQKLWDPVLLSKILKAKIGKQLIFITPDDLTTQNSNLIYKKNNKRITNVILELKQQQIISLDQQILEAIAFSAHCLNDLRSIFICHDKRLMAVIHNQEFYDFLRKKYLQNTEMDILRKVTIKTWSKFDVETLQEILKEKDKYVVKSPHQGKSENMLFGLDSSEEMWKEDIESRKNFIIQEYTPSRKLAIIDIHDENKKTSINTTVGTFMCYRNQYWGIGMFRCKVGRAVCLSNSGFYLGSRIAQKNQFKQDPQILACYSGSQVFPQQIYSPSQIKSLAIQRYKIKEQNDNFKMKKRHIREIQYDWRSKYVSPSGGSSKTQLFVANGFHENHFMRRQLARHFQKYDIINSNDICFNLFSGQYIYKSKQIFNQLCQLCGATPIALQHNGQIQLFKRMMQKFNPNAILGSPSTILRYAYHFQDNPQYQITKLLYSCEHLYETEKKIIRSVFPNARWCSVFGSAETGVWAYSFGGMQDQYIYQFLSDIIKIQVQNPNSQGFGKLLITNLVRKQTPIYRFQMGDYGRLINHNTFSLIAKPQLNSFRMADCDFEVNEIHELLDQCRRWQIILKPENTIQIRIVLKEKEDKMNLREKFINFINSEISQQKGLKILIECQIVESQRNLIACFPSNKIYYIIDERL